MVKRSTKSKSKRTSLRKKHKILEKVKAHGRKERRLKRKKSKENKAKGIKPRLKDPGVPESWPFRDEFLKEMAFEKNRILQQKKSKTVVKTEGDVDLEVDGLDKLAHKAQVQEQNFTQPTTNPPDKEITEDVGGREYFKDFKKVIARSDVVLLVLDARDPQGCRSLEVETLVHTSDTQKRLVFLMNKIDLVSRSVIESWLKYLRQFAPCIAFRSSTQKQNTHLGQTRNRTMETHNNVCLGADHLIQLLKNYTRNADIRTSITVGVVGVPNVGKSSVINSLIRARSAHVGNKPGVTTHMQEFHLDKQIRLLDSPGVIYEKRQGILQGVRKVENLADPVSVIEQILHKVDSETLLSVYQIDSFNSAQEFLQLVANKMGKLKKGGIPDTEGTAKIIIQDWNNGKIPFYTMPPEQEVAKDVQIVQQWAKEFNIDDIYQQDCTVLDSLTEEANMNSANQVETIFGGLEAFSKMAEIREVKGKVAKASAEMSQMNFDSSLAKDSNISNANTLETNDVDSRQSHTPAIQKSNVKVLYAKGQKMSKRDKELYNEQGQYNPHRHRANKKQLKKKARKKSVIQLADNVSNDLKI